MEKLIVKNFGPIKEAEIDLTKYVVFIGDTSTGKSVLAKLVAIFKNAFMILSTDETENAIDLKKELKRFNINFEIDDAELIYYVDDVISLKLIGDKIRLVGKGFRENLLDYFKQFTEENETVNFFSRMPKYDKNEFLKFILNDFRLKVQSVYFPAERLMYSIAGNSLAGLWANNISLSDCFKEFAAKYEVARNEIKNIEFNNFNMHYDHDGGNDNVVLNNNKVLLTEASTGVQTLIPLLLVLENEIKNNDFSRRFIFEEPEVSLFPVKQKLLIEHIVAKTVDSKFDFLITTHSPYILSVLDTLMLAKNTFDEHPDLENEIDAIVSKDKWIDYRDISVYEVKNDGTIRSIKNEEFKSIDTNAIDGVSDIISQEFDKLTELRYAQ